MNITCKAQLSLLENPWLTADTLVSAVGRSSPQGRPNASLRSCRFLLREVLQVETQVLLKPLGCCQGPQPGQGCCAEPSLGELLLFAPATSLWGRIPQLQWKHHTCCSCCCLGGTKHWCRRAGGMAGGGQPAVGSSFFPCNSIYWRVGSCPLWAENAPLTARGSRTDPSAFPGAAGASWAQSGTTT